LRRGASLLFIADRKKAYKSYTGCKGSCVLRRFLICY
jgi:hypothetical protein